MKKRVFQSKKYGKCDDSIQNQSVPRCLNLPLFPLYLETSQGYWGSREMVLALTETKRRLVYLSPFSSYNKIPQTRGLISSRNVYLMVLEAGSPRTG